MNITPLLAQLRLAEAVIAQAFEDVNLWRVAEARWPADHVHSYHDRDIIREGREALSFLTDVVGPWYDSRAAWCLAAGQQENVIRQQALTKYGKGEACPST
jgi:hypothetical protein